MIPGLSYLFVILFALAPWPLRRYQNRTLLISFLIGIVLSVAGALSSILLTAWTDLLVLLVGLSGGVLLGRVLSPKPSRLILVLVFLSVLDFAQFLIFSGPPQSPPATQSLSSMSSPLAYLNLLIPPPLGRFNLGIFDILVIAMVSERFRSRYGSVILSEIPGVAGFVLADLFFLLTSIIGGLPLIPFFTIGFLVSENLRRLVARQHERIQTQVKIL